MFTYEHSFDITEKIIKTDEVLQIITKKKKELKHAMRERAKINARYEAKVKEVEKYRNDCENVQNNLFKCLEKCSSLEKECKTLRELKSDLSRKANESECKLNAALRDKEEFRTELQCKDQKLSTMEQNAVVLRNEILKLSEITEKQCVTTQTEYTIEVLSKKPTEEIKIQSQSIEKQTRCIKSLHTNIVRLRKSGISRPNCKQKSTSRCKSSNVYPTWFQNRYRVLNYIFSVCIQIENSLQRHCHHKHTILKRRIPLPTQVKKENTQNGTAMKCRCITDKLLQHIKRKIANIHQHVTGNIEDLQIKPEALSNPCSVKPDLKEIDEESLESQNVKEEKGEQVEETFEVSLKIVEEFLNEMMYLPSLISPLPPEEEPTKQVADICEVKKTNSVLLGSDDIIPTFCDAVVQTTSVISELVTKRTINGAQKKVTKIRNTASGVDHPLPQFHHTGIQTSQVKQCDQQVQVNNIPDYITHKTDTTSHERKLCSTPVRDKPQNPRTIAKHQLKTLITNIFKSNKTLRRSDQLFGITNRIFTLVYKYIYSISRKCNRMFVSDNFKSLVWQKLSEKAVFNGKKDVKIPNRKHKILPSTNKKGPSKRQLKYVDFDVTTVQNASSPSICSDNKFITASLLNNIDAECTSIKKFKEVSNRAKIVSANRVETFIDCIPLVKKDNDEERIVMKEKIRKHSKKTVQKKLDRNDMHSNTANNLQLCSTNIVRRKELQCKNISEIDVRDVSLSNNSAIASLKVVDFQCKNRVKDKILNTSRKVKRPKKSSDVSLSISVSDQFSSEDEIPLASFTNPVFTSSPKVLNLTPKQCTDTHTELINPKKRRMSNLFGSDNSESQVETKIVLRKSNRIKRKTRKTSQLTNKLTCKGQENININNASEMGVQNIPEQVKPNLEKQIRTPSPSNQNKTTIEKLGMNLTHIQLVKKPTKTTGFKKPCRQVKLISLSERPRRTSKTITKQNKILKKERNKTVKTPLSILQTPVEVILKQSLSIVEDKMKNYESEMHSKNIVNKVQLFPPQKAACVKKVEAAQTLVEIEVSPPLKAACVKKVEVAQTLVEVKVSPPPKTASVKKIEVAQTLVERKATLSENKLPTKLPTNTDNIFPLLFKPPTFELLSNTRLMIDTQDNCDKLPVTSAERPPIEIVSTLPDEASTEAEVESTTKPCKVDSNTQSQESFIFYGSMEEPILVVNTGELAASNIEDGFQTENTPELHPNVVMSFYNSDMSQKCDNTKQTSSQQCTEAPIADNEVKMPAEDQNTSTTSVHECSGKENSELFSSFISSLFIKPAVIRKAMIRSYGEDDTRSSCSSVTGDENEQAEIQLDKFMENPVTYNSVIETCDRLKACKKKNIISLIVAEIVNDNTSILCQNFTPPAPPLTIVQQKIITLIAYLHEELLPFELQHVLLNVMETTLLYVPCNMWKIQKLSRMFVAICRLRFDIERVRMLCCQALYHVDQQALPIMFTALSCWPEVIPISGTVKDNVLLEVLVYSIIHKPCIKVGYEKKPLCNLLRDFYKYNYRNISVNQFATNLLLQYRDNESSMLQYALILFCKNQANLIVYKSVIQPHLFKFILEYVEHASQQTNADSPKQLEISERLAGRSLDLLMRITRPCKRPTDDKIINDIIFQLTKIDDVKDMLSNFIVRKTKFVLSSFGPAQPIAININGKKKKKKNRKQKLKFKTATKKHMAGLKQAICKKSQLK